MNYTKWYNNYVLLYLYKPKTNRLVCIKPQK